MNYAYLRVSTIEQETQVQEYGIREYCAREGIEIDEWLRFTISSRKNIKERGLDDLLDRLKKGDLLIVAEISRLGRSILEMAKIVDRLTTKKVRLIAVKENINIQYVNGNGLDLTSKILMNQFGLMAEIERDHISRRTKEGLALAKSRGVKLGNPHIQTMNLDRGMKSKPYKNELKEIVFAWVSAGYTQREITERLNELEISTLTGRGKWSLQQVQRLLKDCNLKTQRARF